MGRPKHLASFKKPPLNEVVLGVQFEPIQGYTPVDSKEIWDLFKTEYPKVLDQIPIAPQFETFGGVNPQSAIQFQFGSHHSGSRLWFVSEQNDHMLQFQPDRFLINWRKSHDEAIYPHFEAIILNFERYLSQLSDHVISKLSVPLIINQAEISYINLIPVAEFSDLGDWLNMSNLNSINFESFNINFNEIIRDKSDKPYARFYNSIQSVHSIDGKNKAYNFMLTFRGRPVTEDIDSAIAFLKVGRESIVTRFEKVTTSSAHLEWGKL